ncbi:MAG: hypothetical protein E6I81_13940 [Chloroflexi bacterium]|nr:MAG: hypothetical protein AUI15_37315 [Actinobacteria bacterium 13_2_20CM_2_66_6]TMD39020.1 MAG: hypothetical protein E6I89_05760 [Chloroflexota bacterium]TMD70470.1 MAG: hypothetical protein E6I81_13940 [Chloroflexota bacterium]
MLRLVGIVALFVLAACDPTSVKVGPSPSPVLAQGNWNQNLTLTGDLPGQITSIVPDLGAQQTFCSGAKARSGDTWSDSFYANVDSSGNEWQMNIVIENFRGPGTYLEKDVKISLQSADNSKAWLNQDADAAQGLVADKVTFTLARNQQSGTVDAFLTNATSGKRGAEHITGSWNCRG